MFIVVIPMADILGIQALSQYLFDNVYTTVGDEVFNFFNSYSRTILDILHFTFNNLFNIILILTVAMTFMYFIMAIVTYFKKGEKEKLVKNKDLPKVTIQIPTFNELAALNCAQRCLDFDYPKDRMQIIIGDDSNQKEISKKIDAFAKGHKNILVTRRGKNIGFKPGNLNHMLKYTTGDFIVIFDSDFLPEQDFLRRIMAPFVHDKDIHAVQSRWVMKNFNQNLSSIVGSIIPMFSHKMALPFLKMIGSTSFIAGSAEAVRKSTLIELGGWTAGAFTEDIEYSFRMVKAGKKAVYLEKLTCECEAPFTVEDLKKQQMRWAYGVIKAVKMHFTQIFSSKKIPAAWKVNPVLLLGGYLVTFQFFLLFVLGMLSIITHEPAPIQWGVFFAKTGINILLTSGFVISSIIMLNRTNHRKQIPKMIGASYSVGLLVVYTVTQGVLKAIFNRPMYWFMLKKEGNSR